MKIVVQDPDWIAGGAACIDQWDIFTEAASKSSADVEARELAVATCLKDCPMLAECRTFAHAVRPTAGVWAGRLRGLPD